MSESDPSEFQTWDNDPQASVLDRAENMSLPLHEDASSVGATPTILKH